MGALIQKNFRILAITLLILLASGIFVVVKNFSKVEAVLTDGANAVNMVGQYDDDFALDYTKGTRSTENTNNYGIDDVRDVVVDEINHQLFMTDYGNRRVVVYDLDIDNVPVDYIQDFVIGQPDFQSNEQNNGQFEAPISVEVSSDGLYLFVGWTGSLWASSVLVYSLPITENNTAELYHFSDLDAQACDINHIISPNDIEYAETAGNKFLLVADGETNNRVLIYEVSTLSDGLDPVYVLGQPGMASCTGAVSQTRLNTPTGVAYDTGADPDLLTDDRIFIADEENNRVIIHDLSLGALVSGRSADYVLGQGDFIGITAGSEWNKLNLGAPNDYYPTGIVFDKTNNRLLLTDCNNHRIVSYDTTVIVSGATGETATPVADGFSFWGIGGMYYNETRDYLYFSESGRLNGIELSTFVFNIHESYGHIMSIEEKMGLQTGDEQPNGSPNPWSFDDISFVTVDEENHRLFVGDESFGPKVMVFNLNAQNELEDFSADNILGAASLHSKNWYFGDPGNARLTTGATARDAVYDSTSGYLYVADKYRIMVFNTATIDDGEAAEYVFGQDGSTTTNNAPIAPGVGWFSVAGLAIDEENQRLFVADDLYNRVLVFDVSMISNSEVAENVLGVANATTPNEAFCTNAATGNPVALAYDSELGNLFVADDYSGCPRVMVFNVDYVFDGKFALKVLGQSSLSATGAATLDASHFTPAGLDYDSSGSRLFVTDQNNSRILAFDLVEIDNGEAAVNVIGQSLFTTDVAGHEQGRLTDPNDVKYVASSRQVVVADQGGSRVMFFDAANAAPVAPSDFAVADSTAQSVQLTWTDNATDETGFELYVREYGAVDWTDVDLGVGVDQESYPVSDLEPNTHYEFQLIAYNENGYSDSVTTDGRTSAVIPTVPTIIAPDDAAIDVSLNPTFEFTSAVDPDSYGINYRIEFSEDETFVTTDKFYDQRENTLGWSQKNAYGSGDTASFSLPTADYFAAGLTYYWRVRAYVRGLPSDTYSEVRSFTVTDPSPTDAANIPFEDTFITDAGLDPSSSTTNFSSGSIGQSVTIGTFTTLSVFDAAMAKSFDADADGDLDIVRYYALDGATSLQIMMNEGDADFPLGYTNSTGCEDLAVGDVDADGDTDIIIVFGEGYVVATNDGSGVFSLAAETIADFGDSVDIGDIDKDGDLDFIVGDGLGDGNESSIYLNDGTGTFSLWEDSPLVGVSTSTQDVVLADFNGDTYLDFITLNGSALSYLYLNNKNLTFTEVELPFEESPAQKYMTVLDFDSDGDLDIQEYNLFYFNDGLGNFTEDSSQQLLGTTYTTHGHGDFDGDGDEDLLAFSGGDDSIYIYPNNGLGYFDQTGEAAYAFGIDTMVTSKVDVGDYNGDGVLDFHVPSGPNAMYAVNTTNIYFEEETWESTYYVAAVFDANNDGYQDLWQVGGDDNSRIVLLNQGDGTYGELAVEGSEAMRGTVYKAEAVDVDNDGDLDIVEAVYNGKNNYFLNDGLGNLSLVPDGLGLGSYHTVYMRTGDVDNDGNIDIVFLNNDDLVGDENFLYYEIWYGDGNGAFNRNTPTPLDGSTVHTTSFDSGDVNGDGYLDFILPLESGIDSTVMYVYVNNGTGLFDGSIIEGDYENVHNATLGDYDNDGDLDIFADGQFFVNDGTGSFSVSFNLPGIGIGPAESVDIDSDGDLDIIFITEGVDDMRNYILRNQGNWSFVEEQGMFSGEDPTRMVAYGDYDSDGDMDFFTKNAEYYGINYRYTQKQVFSTEVASTVQSVVVATTEDDIVSATLSVYGLIPSDTSVNYYLSTGAQAAGLWENVSTAQEPNYNGFICFVDLEGPGCIVYGEAGEDRFSDDLSSWVNYTDQSWGNVVDIETPVANKHPGLLSSSGIYYFNDDGIEEVCTNLTLTGLNDLALGEDYSYAVGENGVIVLLENNFPAEPTCSIIPALTTANLNAVSIIEGHVSIYGDVDEEGHITSIGSDDGVNFTKSDLPAGVDMNDFLFDYDGGFGVYVGDSGVIWNQLLGFSPIDLESGTDENLYSVNCLGSNCVITGANSTVLTSDDGGQTVTLYDLDLGVDIIDGAIFDSSTYGTGYFVLTDDNEIYYLPLGSGEDDPWQGPIEVGGDVGLPDGEINDLQCFDIDEGYLCLAVGLDTLGVYSQNLDSWVAIPDLPVDDFLKFTLPLMISDTKIYQVGEGFSFSEICTNLALSGLRHASRSNSAIGYAVGEDGLLVMIDTSGPGDPVCTIVDPLTTSNLNFVQKVGDYIVALGDVDEDGDMLILISEDEETFEKIDMSGSDFDPVDLNDLSAVEDSFIVYVGGNGTILRQTVSGDIGDPDLIPSNTTENLTAVSCDASGYCIVIGENGTVITSGDGFETVTNHNLGTSADILSATFFEDGSYANGYVILTADNEVYYLPVGTSIDYFWEGPVTPGSKWTFENSGTSLLWKVELNSDDASETPVLYDVSLSYSTSENIACTDCFRYPPTGPSRLEPDVVSSTSIQWNFADTASDEYGFRLYAETPTLISDVGAANLSYIVEAGLSPNTRYQRNVTAYNGDGESSSAELGPVYTYANTPSISGLVVTGNTSVALSINENSNPNITKYAIYETSLGKWLQLDYTLGTNRVFKTYSEWLAGGSSIPIAGLTNNAMYDFKVQAQNGDDVETDFSVSQSIVVYRPVNANLVLSKKVGVNLAIPVAGVYLGQAVFAGTDTAQKIKIIPLIQRYTNIYTIIAGIMVLLFLMLLVLNAHPKAKHLKHLHKILFTDFVGNNGDLLFEYLHGKKAAKHGLIYRNHHRFYKLTNLGFMGFVFGLCMKVVVVCITAFLVYSTVQVQAFENQSGVDVKAGDKLTYQVEYLNNGGQTAHGILVNEPIPSGSTYVAGSLTSTGSKCVYANNLITCNIGELASDAKGVLEFQANVTGSVGNTIIDIASVTYTEGTGTTNSNSTTNAIVGEVETCGSGEICEVILGSGWNYFRMAVTAKVRFLHNNATHAVELTSSTLATKKGSVRVTSDPINVNLDEDEIKSVDSDGNTLNDLDLTIQTVVSDAVSVVGIREAGEVVLPVCGDTQCNGTETCETCAGDCGVCPAIPVCGDNACNGTETCNSCSSDCGVCPAIPVCGDNACNGNETCADCSRDCGVCIIEEPEIPGGVKHACGDNIDNDNDGKIDYPADLGCVSLTDDDETDEIEEVIIVSEVENKVIDTISTIVSGLTQGDYTQVRETVAKTIKQVGAATINNKTVQQVNNVAQQPITIAATVASVASIATVGATGAAGVGLLTYLQFLFTQPLMILTKRKRHNWGVIYNSITKKPIDLAIIRLFEFGTNHLVTTRVTDKQGRYHFFVKPGKYYIEVNKKEHKFPSEIIPQLIGLHITGGEAVPIDENIIDGEYQNLYNGGIIEVKEGDGGFINKAIPVDPDKKVETDKAVFKRLMWKKVQTLSTIIGPVLAMISFVVNPHVWVGALVIFQVIIYFIFRRLAKAHKPLTWGFVKDFLTGRELRKTVVRVFDTRFNKLLDTQVTDNKGKYGFLVSKGEYYLTGDKEGYEAYKSSIFDLTKKEAAYLAEEIKMRKREVASYPSPVTSNQNNVDNQPDNLSKPKGRQVPPPQSLPTVPSEQKVEGTDKEDYYDLDVLKKD